MKKEYPATLRMEKEVIINNRHVWLWYISSENDVVHAWLLQWEEESMEVLDKYYTCKENEKAIRAFDKKVMEIVKAPQR